MVLADGNDQIELIKSLRKRYNGIEIILVDINPNVRAKEYADKMLVISTMDMEAVTMAAKQEGIDLILVNCGDQPLRTMAYVSEKLNLPCYLTYQQSELLTNKRKMKEIMVSSGIPTSKHHRFNIKSKPETDGLKFPLVVKPADNNGSKGVIKVYNDDELIAAIAESRKYTMGGDLILEEYKEGTEYSIEAFIKNGEPILVFPSQNTKIEGRNSFTICKNQYVPQLSDALKHSILAIIKKIGSAFKIDNTPLLIQLIVGSDGEINVIEFAPRTGGGSKLFFIRRMTGVDIIENLLDISEGKEPDITVSPSKESAAICYLYAQKGIFQGFKNLTKLSEEGIIEEMYLYKPYGTNILSSDYSSDRPAGILVTATNDEALKAKINLIDREIGILNENGLDIMIHGIFN